MKRARSPVYPTLRLWILGRIWRAPSMQRSLHNDVLYRLPEYLAAGDLDVVDELKRLVADGLIACTSRRWWIRSPRAAKLALLKVKGCVR